MSVHNQFSDRIKILELFFLSRLWTALFVYAGHIKRLMTFQGGPAPWEGVSNWWLNPWTCFDSEWYLRIATRGYEPNTLGFYPLYPALLRFVSFSANGMALWGICLSNAAFLSALFILFRIAEKDFGRQIAWHAVAILAFFPTSCFFSAVYAESFFLLLLLACYYQFKLKHYATAGIFGFLAGLARNSGWLISLALLGDYFVDIYLHKRKGDAKNIFFMGLPMVAFLGVQFYGYSVTHDVFSANLNHLNFSGRVLDYPWRALVKDAYALFSPVMYSAVSRGGGFVLWINWSVTVLSLVFSYRLIRKYQVGYAALILGTILVTLSFRAADVPYTTGIARYISTVFPFMIVAGDYLNRLVQKRGGFVLAYGMILTSSMLQSLLFGAKHFSG